MQLEYKLDNRDGVNVMRLKGRFDTEGAAFVKSQITGLVNEQHPNLAVDMSEVSFLDSLGLAALVSGLKLCRRNQGAMMLIGLQPSTKMLFEVTRLDKAFQLYEDEESAFAELKH
jgi:anti-sigma B factor antagonist